jgi:ankyrin repeat protein
MKADWHGRLYVWSAVRTGHLDIVVDFFHRAKDRDCVHGWPWWVRQNTRDTLLHEAMRYGRKEIVVWLLEHHSWFAREKNDVGAYAIEYNHTLAPVFESILSLSA